MGKDMAMIQPPLQEESIQILLTGNPLERDFVIPFTEKSFVAVSRGPVAKLIRLAVELGPSRARMHSSRLYPDENCTSDELAGPGEHRFRIQFETEEFLEEFIQKLMSAE